MSSGSSDPPFVSVDGVPIPEFALPPGPFAADWESLKGYRIPAWFEDAKFGIFLHWGVYGVPAFGNEWYPRNMYQPDSKEHAHHVATYGPVSESGYKDFIPKFTAERFDPDAWAELFAASGAKP
jgi:alpha-L-fucosidase